MKNKQLLIHVGYPKTGSSTMQFGLFKDLHESGLLNLKTWRQEDPQEPLADRLSSLLFQRRPISDKYRQLQEGMLNIISDESLTAPLRLRRINFGENIEDPINFPSLLRNEFLKEIENGLEVKILVVIRNQADLLYSQYVEEYKLVLYKSIDILHNNLGNIDLHGMEVYDYSNYLESLQNVFGKDKITLCLFEDWKNDPNHFFKQISSVVNADNQKVAELLTKTHKNKKAKTDKGYLTEVSKIQIEYLSNNERSQIMNFFASSNIRLESEWGISHEKLVDYGYIN